MSATDRFKMLLASALERVCILEDQLEQAQAIIAEQAEQLEQLRAISNGAGDPEGVVADDGD